MIINPLKSIRLVISCLCFVLLLVYQPKAIAQAEPTDLGNAQTKELDHNTQDLSYYYSPTSFLTEYELKSDTFLGGVGKRTLKSLGNHQFRLELVVKSIFLTNREISQFRLNNCEITPIHYRYERTGIGKDKRYLLEFSKDLRSVEYEANKTKKLIPLKDGHYLDRLSETLALQCLLAQGETDMHTLIVEKDTIREHKFQVTGTEVLDTQAGKFKALKVERIRAPSSDRRTILWFAPGLDYQLIKMTQIEDGRTFELLIKSYNR